jgi:hypothetical protein
MNEHFIFSDFKMSLKSNIKIWSDAMLFSNCCSRVSETGLSNKMILLHVKSWLVVLYALFGKEQAS